MNKERRDKLLRELDIRINTRNIKRKVMVKEVARSIAIEKEIKLIRKANKRERITFIIKRNLAKKRAQSND